MLPELKSNNFQRRLSALAGSRRAASRMSAYRSNRRVDPHCGEPAPLLDQHRLTGSQCGERMRGRRWSGHVTGEQRTGWGRSKGGRRSGCGSGHPCRHAHRHGAVVRPVPPATSRQTGILARFESRRKRSKPEEQDQEDGEAAPHLTIMLTQIEGLQSCRTANGTITAPDDNFLAVECCRVSSIHRETSQYP